MMTRPWWWWPYQLWKYLVFFPVATTTTLLGSAIVFVLIPFVDASTLSRAIAVRWARFCAWIVPMPVTVTGRDHVDPHQSYVVAANHQSLFDILVLYGWLGIDFRWVMKHELRSVPGLGIACDKLGHIYIDRSDHEAAVASINAARKRISGGTSVLFFPEGTRSDDGRLRRFKKGAFRFAIDTHLPVLPVTVVGTSSVLPARRYDLRPGKASMVIHEPIRTAGLTSADLPDLSNRAREVIVSALPADADAAGG
jgi:1-acyl-sn-glycerol-3-phosphate acyltransferase